MSLYSGSETWLEEEGSWVKILPRHRLFKEATCSNYENYLLCETRGDLFVWSPELQCLLTTNLKRIHAQRNEPHVYQKLHPTILPVTPPTSLIPSLNGNLIALVSTSYVNVMTLRHSRGPHGEFNSGVDETDCRTVAIGNTIIRAHCLQVIKAQWCPEVGDNVISIMTNDDKLRLYDIADPNIPLVTLNTTLQPTSTHALKLPDEERIISYYILNNTVYLLQDGLGVQTLTLKEGSLPSMTLSMYPLMDDNYNGRGCDVLVLATTPPVLVIASDNGGMVLHCVYCNGSDETDDNGDAILSVVESISLNDSTDDSNGLKLIPDPVARNSYCIKTNSAVYSVHLSWISNLEEFTEDAPSFSATPPAVVTQVFAQSYADINICDSLLISDDLLGEAIIMIDSNGECQCIKNDQPSSHSFGYLPSSPTSTSPFLSIEHTLPNEFVQQIELLLKSGMDHQLSLPPPPEKSTDVVSQKFCYKFLESSIKILREQYLDPQKKANSLLVNRMKLLAHKRDRQVKEFLNIEEESEKIVQSNENLLLTIKELEERCSHLTKRVELTGCLVSKASPVLSDAEVALGKDLVSMKENLERLKSLLRKARSKVDLGLDKVTSPNSSAAIINQTNLQTVLDTIADNGRSIKNSVEIVKSLAGAMDTNLTT